MVRRRQDHALTAYTLLRMPPAYQTIADTIAQQIRDGELPPGIRLPSYSDLAHQHHVSEIVIRRAITLLTQQGLVYTVERKGAYITGATDPVPPVARITIHPNINDGRPTIRDTGVKVADVLTALATSSALTWPDIDADDVNACLTWAAASANRAHT